MTMGTTCSLLHLHHHPLYLYTPQISLPLPRQPLLDKMIASGSSDAANLNSQDEDEELVNEETPKLELPPSLHRPANGQRGQASYYLPQPPVKVVNAANGMNSLYQYQSGCATNTVYKDNPSFSSSIKTWSVTQNMYISSLSWMWRWSCCSHTWQPNAGHPIGCSGPQVICKWRYCCGIVGVPQDIRLGVIWPLTPMPLLSSVPSFAGEDNVKWQDRGNSHWHVLVTCLLMCHWDRHATVTMSSGKPFDCQLALALQADASLIGLLLSCWYVLVTCLLMHPCCLLADVSLSLACQCILGICLLMHPCHLLADVSSTWITMSSGKPFDCQFIQYTVPLSFLPGVGLLQLRTLYQTGKWPVHTLHFSIRLSWWLILQVSAVHHTYIPLLSTFTNVWAGSSTSSLCVML